MKKAISLFLVLIMVLSLAACDGGSTSTDNASSSDPASDSDTAEKVNDRELNLIMKAQLGTASPSENNNIFSTIFLNNIFEALVYYDEKSGEVSGRVADKWEYAADNSYIDFHINPNVTFHDGSKVTAEDVAFSYDLIAAGSRFTRQLDMLGDWEVVSEDTFRINLTGATAIPMLYVADIRIVSKANVTAAGDRAFMTAETTIGTGPYKLETLKFDGETVMKAYADYYRGEASIKTINWTYLTDASTSLVAFQTGNFDFIDLPTANVVEMEAMNKYNVIHNPSTHNSFVGINASVIPNPLVRQAIMYAIDSEQVMNVTYNGLGQLSKNMAETGMVGGGYSFDDYYDYNPEKAVELLKQAGYTQAQLDAGVPMGNIVAMSTNYYAKVATVLQQMLAQVGLKFEVTALEQATIEDMWYRRVNGDQCAIICHGDTIKVDSSTFYTGYIYDRDTSFGFSDKLVELGAKAVCEYDEAKRNELWKDFWIELKELAIYYSLFHRDTMYIATNDLNVVLGVSYYHVYDWSWK